MTKPLSTYQLIAEVVKTWADRIDRVGPGIDWEIVSPLADEMRAFSNDIAAATRPTTCPTCDSPSPEAKHVIDTGKRLEFVCNDRWHDVAMSNGVGALRPAVLPANEIDLVTLRQTLQQWNDPALRTIISMCSKILHERGPMMPEDI